jgi:glutathione peroxidase
MQDSFYQFTARSLQGKEIKMDSYSGKVILVVNTASICG